jgi:hypothetical protein
MKIPSTAALGVVLAFPPAAPSWKPLAPRFWGRAGHPGQIPQVGVSPRKHARGCSGFFEHQHECLGSAAPHMQPPPVLYPPAVETPMRDDVVAVRPERDEKEALAVAAKAQARTLAGMMRAATLDWLRRNGHLPQAEDRPA